MLNQLNAILIQRLEDRGIVPTAIPGFFRSVIIAMSNNNDMSLQEVNRRLNLLGWDAFEMDDQTLQLILANFEAEGLMNAEEKK